MGEREHEWPWLPAPHPDAVGQRAAAEPLSDVLARRLLAERVVLLHGTLDDLSVTRVAAELMTLDAQGDDPVTLRVDCGEAALAPALTLMDVIELGKLREILASLRAATAAVVGAAAPHDSYFPARSPGERTVAAGA